ncbi:MAG TPA: acyl-CoA dehydrogenase family protein [Candidatus Dormibacteraeota bacterium]|nr:acyl-CoA dehydrogenase family protein [Candidatus Dormibacteraeota bacterium]
MDFGLTAAEERFREEVCAFLSTPRVRDAVRTWERRPPGEEPGLLDVYRWLGERGWLAVSWPVEYGGLGGSAVDKLIVTEELILHGVPEVVYTLSVDIVGPLLLASGTPEQRRRLLPPLARGERSAAVLFTEPGVGSDLAALRTRAERDGDGWRLHGTKTFNVKTAFADFAVCAARTTRSDVPFHGITLFLLPLKTPGVVVRPMPGMADDRFNEVTLEGIRLTRADVVGEVDGGWRAINDLLRLERTGVEFEARARRWLDVTLRHAARTGGLDDRVLGHRLVELDAMARASRLLALRAVTDLRDGTPDDVVSATAKWYSSELGRRVAACAMDVLGLAGGLSRWDGEAPDGGLLEAALREAPGLTLASGTSEIMLSIIASRGLELAV